MSEKKYVNNVPLKFTIIDFLIILSQVEEYSLVNLYLLRYLCGKKYNIRLIFHSRTWRRPLLPPYNLTLGFYVRFVRFNILLF